MKMDSGDCDIYDDLENFDTKQKLKEKNVEFDLLQQKYLDALKRIKQLEIEHGNFQKKFENMEKNFTSLFYTAKSEIKRKDNQIQELRKEKDDIIFRRRNYNRNFNANDVENEGNIHQRQENRFRIGRKLHSPIRYDEHLKGENTRQHKNESRYEENINEHSTAYTHRAHQIDNKNKKEETKHSSHKERILYNYSHTTQANHTNLTDHSSNRDNSEKSKNHHHYSHSSSESTSQILTKNPSKLPAEKNTKVDNSKSNNERKVSNNNSYRKLITFEKGPENYNTNSKMDKSETIQKNPFQEDKLHKEEKRISLKEYRNVMQKIHSEGMDPMPISMCTQAPSVSCDTKKSIENNPKEIVMTPLNIIESLRKQTALSIAGKALSHLSGSGNFQTEGKTDDSYKNLECENHFKLPKSQDCNKNNVVKTTNRKPPSPDKDRVTLDEIFMNENDLKNKKEQNENQFSDLSEDERLYIDLEAVNESPREIDLNTRGSKKVKTLDVVKSLVAKEVTVSENVDLSIKSIMDRNDEKNPKSVEQITQIEKINLQDNNKISNNNSHTKLITFEKGPEKYDTNPKMDSFQFEAIQKTSIQEDKLTKVEKRISLKEYRNRMQKTHSERMDPMPISLCTETPSVSCDTKKSIENNPKEMAMIPFNIIENLRKQTTLSIAEKALSGNFQAEGKTDASYKNLECENHFKLPKSQDCNKNNVVKTTNRKPPSPDKDRVTLDEIFMNERDLKNKKGENENQFSDLSEDEKLYIDLEAVNESPREIDLNTCGSKKVNDLGVVKSLVAKEASISKEASTSKEVTVSEKVDLSIKSIMDRNDEKIPKSVEQITQIEKINLQDNNKISNNNSHRKLITFDKGPEKYDTNPKMDSFQSETIQKTSIQEDKLPKVEKRISLKEYRNRMQKAHSERMDTMPISVCTQTPSVSCDTKKSIENNPKEMAVIPFNIIENLRKETTTIAEKALSHLSGSGNIQTEGKTDDSYKNLECENHFKLPKSQDCNKNNVGNEDSLKATNRKPPSPDKDRVTLDEIFMNERDLKNKKGENENQFSDLSEDEKLYIDLEAVNESPREIDLSTSGSKKVNDLDVVKSLVAKEASTSKEVTVSEDVDLPIKSIMDRNDEKIPKSVEHITQIEKVNLQDYEEVASTKNKEFIEKLEMDRLDESNSETRAIEENTDLKAILEKDTRPEEDYKNVSLKDNIFSSNINLEKIQTSTSTFFGDPIQSTTSESITNDDSFNKYDSIERQLQNIFQHTPNKSENIPHSYNRTSTPQSVTQSISNLDKGNSENNSKCKAQEMFDLYLGSPTYVIPTEIEKHKCKEKTLPPTPIISGTKKRKYSTPRKSPNLNGRGVKLVGHRIEGFEPGICGEKALEASKLKNDLFKEILGTDDVKTHTDNAEENANYNENNANNNKSNNEEDQCAKENAVIMNNDDCRGNEGPLKLDSKTNETAESPIKVVPVTTASNEEKDQDNSRIQETQSFIAEKSGENNQEENLMEIKEEIDNGRKRSGEFPRDTTNKDVSGNDGKQNEPKCSKSLQSKIESEELAADEQFPDEKNYLKDDSISNSEKINILSIVTIKSSESYHLQEILNGEEQIEQVELNDNKNENNKLSAKINDINQDNIVENPKNLLPESNDNENKNKKDSNIEKSPLKSIRNNREFKETLVPDESIDEIKSPNKSTQLHSDISSTDNPILEETKLVVSPQLKMERTNSFNKLGNDENLINELSLDENLQNKTGITKFVEDFCKSIESVDEENVSDSIASYDNKGTNRKKLRKKKTKNNFTSPVKNSEENLEIEKSSNISKSSGKSVLQKSKLMERTLNKSVHFEEKLPCSSDKIVPEIDNVLNKTNARIDTEGGNVQEIIDRSEEVSAGNLIKELADEWNVEDEESNKNDLQEEGKHKKRKINRKHKKSKSENKSNLKDAHINTDHNNQTCQGMVDRNTKKRKHSFEENTETHEIKKQKLCKNDDNPPFNYPSNEKLEQENIVCEKHSKEIISPEKEITNAVNSILPKGDNENERSLPSLSSSSTILSLTKENLKKMLKSLEDHESRPYQEQQVSDEKGAKKRFRNNDDATIEIESDEDSSFNIKESSDHNPESEPVSIRITRSRDKLNSRQHDIMVSNEKYSSNRKSKNRFNNNEKRNKTYSNAVQNKLHELFGKSPNSSRSVKKKRIKKSTTATPSPLPKERRTELVSDVTGNHGSPEQSSTIHNDEPAQHKGEIKSEGVFTETENQQDCKKDSLTPALPKEISNQNNLMEDGTTEINPCQVQSIHNQSLDSTQKKNLHVNDGNLHKNSRNVTAPKRLHPDESLESKLSLNSMNNTTATVNDSCGERKLISTTAREYLIETVDNNVVNVYITRKKKRKKAS